MDDRAKLDQLRTETEAELLGNILPYWMRRTPDEKHGGFVGRIMDRGEVFPEAPKGGILNARILWTFSAAHRMLRQEAYLRFARRAFDYVKAHFWDPQNGGIHWSVDYQGRPLDAAKHVYSNSFGIYGLSEYYRATQDREALERAIDIYRLFEEHAHDPASRGYFESFDPEWKRVNDGRLSNAELKAEKTMNTHLHIMEAYVNLLRAWPDAGLKARVKELVEVFLDHIIDPSTHHLLLFFRPDWTSLSNVVSYGHDIEASWLLAEAAEVHGDEDLRHRVHEATLPMVDAVLKEGTDPDGGILNEREGEHVDGDKHWWPQAEGVVGYLNAYQETKNPAYLDAALKTWQFTRDHLVDLRFGEWYWRTNREGVPYPNNEKVGMWKCPYHNSRMCLEVLART